VHGGSAAAGASRIGPSATELIAIGHTAGQPTVSIRKVMRGMVPILALFECKAETSVEVRYSPRYRPQRPGTTQEMHDAMVKMFDLRVEAARVWSTPEPGQQAAIYPTINAGVSSNSGKPAGHRRGLARRSDRSTEWGAHVTAGATRTMGGARVRKRLRA
jgi:hypothetical protein